MEELKNYTTEDYNNEPVYYCKNCLSLKIKVVGGYDFCDDLGDKNYHVHSVNQYDFHLHITVHLSDYVILIHFLCSNVLLS